MLAARGDGAASLARSVKTVDLGETSAGKLVADIEFQPTGPGGFGEFFVEFKTIPHRSGARAKMVVVDTGAGALENLVVESADYTHRGRKQLFISSYMQAQHTHVLDYDGRHVRTLYTPSGGRIIVKPVRANRGRWELIERWAKSQYTEDNLGVAYQTAPNEVSRVMVWKHGRFVPKHPGPTTIIVQSPD